jgi:protease II
MIEDDYAWLRDPGYPMLPDEVLGYLKAENAYFSRDGAHAELVETLFEEMKGRIRRMTQRSGPGWRLFLLVGFQAGRAVGQLVPQAVGR